MCTYFTLQIWVVIENCLWNGYLFFSLQPDGLYSIILCNTTSDEDVYINDVLIKENLAEVDSKEDNIEPVDTYNSYAIQPPVSRTLLRNFGQGSYGP